MLVDSVTGNFAWMSNHLKVTAIPLWTSAEVIWRYCNYSRKRVTIVHFRIEYILKIFPCPIYGSDVVVILRPLTTAMASFLLLSLDFILLIVILMASLPTTNV